MVRHLTVAISMAIALSYIIFFLQEELSNGENEDEGVNRAASLLSAFKNIIAVSCWCEPKVVSLIFQATKEQKLDQETVAKVCETIIKYVLVRTSYHILFAISHLPFTVGYLLSVIFHPLFLIYYLFFWW